MEKLLTPQDTADLLGVKVSTVYSWAYKRQIPVQKVGRLLRISPASLQIWLKEQEKQMRK